MDEDLYLMINKITRWGFILSQSKDRYDVSLQFYRSNDKVKLFIMNDATVMIGKDLERAIRGERLEEILGIES
jgi:hypothetical protein